MTSAKIATDLAGLERRLLAARRQVAKTTAKLATDKEARAVVIREASDAGLSLATIANLVDLSKGGVDKIVNDRYSAS